MKSWKSWQKFLFWTALVLFILFGLPFVVRGAILAWGYANPYAKTPVLGWLVQQPGESPVDPCIVRALELGFPSTDVVCKTPTSNKPAQEMVSGDAVEFGSITFDWETRVWVLSHFYVPDTGTASYPYEYVGRERSILNAPFFTGSQVSPVDNKPFRVCYDTTSTGCIPPYKVEFYTP